MTNRQAAIKIIGRLRKEGFQALLAGGCVRDMLIGRAAKDYDVAASARPDDIIKLFKRTVKVGAKFGVVMVILQGRQVEVAAFRAESGYADGRHPDNVEFSNAKKDAERRDFTINGMFYDPIDKKVIDYVDGQGDLRKRILRTIGDAGRRFSEDYLRMLRAVRFAAELDFNIADSTWQAICDLSANITKISGERTAMELEANPNRAKAATILFESGLSKAIFPGFDDEKIRFGIEVLGHLPKKIDFALAMAGFFADCTAESVINWCGILKLSNAHNKHLRFLLAGRSKLLDAEMALADLKLLLATPYFWDLYNLQKAIQAVKGQNTKALSVIKKRAEELKGSELKPEPLLNGHELIALGVRRGPMVGLAGQEMYIAQLGEELQTAEQAEEWVRQWLKKRRNLKE